MGSTNSTFNSSFSAANIVTDVFIDITQNISQGLSSQQELIVDCNSDGSGKYCLNCIQAWKKISNNPDIAENVCDSVCVCSVKNVDMDQSIILDLEAWQKYNDKADFLKKINQSISQSAYSSGQSLYSIGDRQSNISDVVNNLFDSMKSDTFMEAIQSVKNLQLISLKGAGNVANVNLNNFMDYFSQILQTNDSTSSVIDKLEVSILQLTTQVTDAGLARLILWIVRIVIGILMLIILFYSMQYIFQIYTLYVQK